MKIAVDLSPLQNAHRMRGIGFTLINFLNNLPIEAKKTNRFVFFVLPDGEALFKDPLELLKLDGLTYEVLPLKPIKRLPFRLPGRLNLPFGAVNRLLRFHSFYFGDSRIPKLSDIDVFLQADQNHLLPSGNGFKKILIIYDLIPQILAWDYMWDYETARLHGNSRLKSFIYARKRNLLINKTRKNTRKADELIAISEHTKKDFVRFLKVPAEKINVVPLGVTRPSTDEKTPTLRNYLKTSWGYLKNPSELKLTTPFLLFVGGADSRRKLEDLVAAFNHLRAEGHDLKLVLSGDIMLGPSAITTKVISKSLAKSSYLDDIIFMGFVDDNVRDWLYAHALAYVFPSRYEGFGLPVLEAMVHGCPVISYKNDAVLEVAGDAPLYTDRIFGIMDSIKELLNYTEEQREDLRKKSSTIAQKYDWEKTSNNIILILARS